MSAILVTDPLPSLRFDPRMTASTVMAGLVPAIPIRKALRFTGRDHRHKAGDDVAGLFDLLE